MRVLGLDVGDKRIGVAISDALGLTAQGLTTLDREGCIGAIKEIIKEYKADSIVVGVPKMLNGSIGIQAGKVLGFVEELRLAVNLPVTLWDERLSTTQADKIMLEAGVRGRKRMMLRDKVAAVIILQCYLDSIRR